MPLGWNGDQSWEELKLSNHKKYNFKRLLKVPKYMWTVFKYSKISF